MGKLSGVAQGQMRGSFSMKKLCPLHLFSLRGSRGSSEADRGLSGFLGGIWGAALIGKYYVPAFIFLWIVGGLIDLWIRTNNF